MLLNEKELIYYNKRIQYSQKLKISCDICFKEYIRNNHKLYLEQKEKYKKDLCLSCKQKEQYKIGIKKVSDETKLKISNFQAQSWASKYGEEITEKRKAKLKIQRSISFIELYGEDRAKEISKKISKSNSRTYIEKYGEEKTNELKQRKSEKLINRSWASKYGEEKAARLKQRMSDNNNFVPYNRAQKGKTYEEIYGEKKAKEIKEKLKHSYIYSADRQNKAIAGSLKSGKGIYKGYSFRSFFELSYIKYLLDNDIKFESGEQEKHCINYIFENKKTRYYPDFYLIDTDETIEIKPKYKLSDLKNIAKFEAAKNKLGSKFVILTEDNLNLLTRKERRNLIKNKQVFLF